MMSALNSGQQSLVSIDKQLENERKRILRKRKEFRKSGLHLLASMSILAILLLAWGLMHPLIIQTSAQNYDVIELFFILIGIVFGFDTLIQFTNLLRKPKMELSYEETLFLDVYDALTQVEAYINDPLETYRLKTDEILSRRVMFSVDSWDAGALKVCQAEMNPILSLLKKLSIGELLELLKEKSVMIGERCSLY